METRTRNARCGEYGGEIDIDGQIITFNFRKGINTGKLTFTLWYHGAGDEEGVLPGEDDMIPDKDLQERRLREREESYFPNKWIRSIDAYRALCPEDPMGLEEMRHRAADDAVMEGWVLKVIYQF